MVKARGGGGHAAAGARRPGDDVKRVIDHIAGLAKGGTALGAPVVGRLINSHGAAAGYLFAFAAGLEAFAMATLGRRRPAR